MSAASKEPFSPERPLRVCFFGTYRGQYTRNQVMIERMRSANIEVVECHEELWYGDDDREQAATGGWRQPAFWGRVLRAYWRLLSKYRQMGAYDVLFVGYPGHFDVYLARLLSWLRRKPLVWDILMSLYLIAAERHLEQKSRFTVEAIRWIEKTACRLPDRLIMDTQAYVRWMGENYAVPPERFRMIPLGADERFFRPFQVQPGNPSDHKFLVIYYGTFIPNHGLPYVVEAARRLQNDPDIHFEFIGSGPDQKKVHALAKELGLQNITFFSWLEKDVLAQRLAQADVILGTFGVTVQSVITVQNKIYEGMAMSKPVLTGDSPAVREALVHGEHVYLVERTNPEAIVQAIQQLKAQPALRQRLSRTGRQFFCDHYTTQKLGADLRTYFIELIQSQAFRT